MVKPDGISKEIKIIKNNLTLAIPIKRAVKFYGKTFDNLFIEKT